MLTYTLLHMPSFRDWYFTSLFLPETLLEGLQLDELGLKMDSLVSFQEALQLLAKEPKPHKSATQQSLFILRLKGARK